MPCLIDLPRRFNLSQYHRSIEKMVQFLKNIEGVIAVYQIGSISTPGISDIDMLVVFRDGSKYLRDVRESLLPEERYLFAHGLFGLCESHVVAARRYCFYFEFQHLWGKDPLGNRREDTFGVDQDVMKIQVALEFLAKMYIVQYIEKTFGVVKVRGLLLQAKALMKDLEYLGVHSGKLMDLLKTVAEWRATWFERESVRTEICDWIIEFRLELDRFLAEMCTIHRFFLPNEERRIARNIIVRHGDCLSAEHCGWILPRLGVKSKMYLQLNHRFIQFIFQFPAVSTDIPLVIRDAASFYTEMKIIKRNQLPHFMTLSTNL